MLIDYTLSKTNYFGFTNSKKNKMRKTIKVYSVIDLMVCITSVANSQGVYVNFGPGFNFSGAGSVIG